VVEERERDGTIVVGSVVGIEFGPGEEPEQYLVGHIEERREGLDVLSPESPLGAKLLGKRAGDQATYEVKGNTLTVKIASVD
jgi:transcription elongation factor GreA